MQLPFPCRLERHDSSLCDSDDDDSYLCDGDSVVAQRGDDRLDL